MNLILFVKVRIVRCFRRRTFDTTSKNRRSLSSNSALRAVEIDDRLKAQELKDREGEEAAVVVEDAEDLLHC